jgi:hypothetical protein
MQALFAALASDDEHEIVVADEELGPSIMLDSQVFESTAAAVPCSLTWSRPPAIVAQTGYGW